MSNIIDTIEKLLALADPARGGTDAEREVAMQKAQKLMQKHNLDFAAISSNKRSADGDVTDNDIIIKGAMNQWRRDLYAAVAGTSFVHAVWFKYGKHEGRLLLVGRPDNLAFVRTLTDHLIPWLEDECKRASKDEEQARGEAFFNPRAFKRSFMQSATYRIHSRLSDMWRGVESGHELIRNETAANKKHLEDIGVSVKKGHRSRGSGEASGHSAGREAGDRADLTPGRKLAH